MLNTNINSLKVNGRIRAREVRVISATSEPLGVMSLTDALHLAQESGQDLIEVVPNAEPPVCKVMNLGKYRYEQEKHKSKPTQSKLKEVKFRVNIADNDYQIKLRHITEFISESNKVRVQLQFRGREMAHQDLGMVLMRRIKADVSTVANVEIEPKQAGRNISMTLAPIPANKRKA